MSEDSCPFCAIVEGRERAHVLYSSDRCVVFLDRRPQQRVHYVIASKQHIESLEDTPPYLLRELVLTARDAARKLDLTGYRILFNVKKSGGQRVAHVHAHLLSKAEGFHV